MKRKHDEAAADYVPLSRLHMKTNDEGRIEENTDLSTNAIVTPEFVHHVHLYIDHEKVATMDNRNVSATLGRSSRCDVQVDNPSVSSLHCCFVMKSDGLYVVDLNSTNGTFVESPCGCSRRISKDHVLLRHEDIIYMDTIKCSVTYA